MNCLLDTNVLVYRFDPRNPEKQAIATELIRVKLEQGQAKICHQSLVEFVAATTRPLRENPAISLLTPEEAAWETEELVRQLEVLYPCEGQVRLALRGWRTYGLSWFDAHLWSYAEYFDTRKLFSEDFQHGRTYGMVQVINPFIQEPVK